MSVGCVNLAHVTMKFEPDEATWVLSSTDVGLAAVVGEGAFSRGLDYAIGGKVVALATADRGRVLMGTVTGNGLKDPEWAISGAPAPVTIPVDAAAAAAQLGL